MSSPITWRNVTGPGNTDVFRGMDSAGRNITSGFDMLGKVIADRQAVNQGVEDRGRQAGQEDYLNYLNTLKTPEAVREAQLSGVLDQRVAALDPRNQSAVRGAADALLTSRQQQATSGNAFADANELRAQRPVEEQILVARARGDNVLADSLTNQLTRNQGTFLEANRTASRQRGKDTQADLLGAINDPLALVEAKAKAERAPAAAELAARELKFKGTQLTGQEQAAADTQEDRVLASITAQTAQAYQVGQLQDRIKLGPLAAKRGYPLDASGAPDVARMKDPELKQLDADAKAAGLRGTAELFTGDTKVGNTFMTGLSSDPRFTPAGLARNQAKIVSAFNTTSTGAPAGNDAALLARNQAQADVVQTEQDASNWYAPNSPNALKNYEELSKEIAPLFTDSPEDLPHVQELVYKLSTTGLDLGKGKFLTPSKQDVLGAVRSTYEGWNIRNRGRSEDIEKFLKNNLDTSRVTGLLKQAEESKVANRQRAVREILNPTKKQ